MSEWLRLFDDHVAVQPPLSEEQLLHLPGKRGVALLAGGDDGQTPILLLTAADIRQRLRGRLESPREDHRTRRADLREITTAVYWKRAYSHFQADLQFLRLAAAIWPDRYEQLAGCKPAVFVHVDPLEPRPRWVRTQEVFASAGRYIGSFPSSAAADRFIESIQDAFDLCRLYRCLMQAPDSSGCSYAQMGRCVGVCNGAMSLEDYRRLVARSAEFAEGRRDEKRLDLQTRMKAAADQLQFEKAAGLKARLHRLADFDKADYQWAAPAEAFRFIIIQAGPTARQAQSFLADRGRIEEGPAIPWPLEETILQSLLDQMRRWFADRAAFDPFGRWVMGLVSHYLRCSPQRRGVMVRWRDDLSAAELAGAIHSAAGDLRLGKRKGAGPPAAKEGEALPPDKNYNKPQPPEA